MVIDDLDLPGVAAPPLEADAPLVVDPDAVLTLSGALQGFEPVSGWRTQLAKRPHGIEGQQFTPRDPLYLYEPASELVAKKRFGIPILEAPYHEASLFRQPYSVKQNSSYLVRFG
jgi:hypothetical protein